MNKEQLRKIGIPLFFLLLAALALAGLLGSRILPGKREKQQEKVGLILTGSVTEEGWNGMNYEGIRAACEEAGMELLVRDQIMEYTGQCTQAVSELLEEGAGIIFLTSYNYGDEAKELIDSHPEVVFYTDSAYAGEQTNIATYFPRMYQARYLAGLVAGASTKTGVIGYVAAMKNSEVIRGINAFTLGVLKANPDAQVVVGWTGSWNHAEQEKKTAQRLVEKAGADILTYHQNLPNVVEEAEKLGVSSIAYHLDGTKVSANCLTSVMCDWKKLYQEILKDYRSGKAAGGDFLWLGLDRQVTLLGSYGEQVSAQARELVEQETKKILDGRDIFSGELYDTEGQLRCAPGETIPDKTLMFDMDWFVKGVTFYEN